MDSDSLEVVLDYLNRHDVTDGRIYATLAPTNTVRLGSLLIRFQRIANATYSKNSKRPKHKKDWVPQQRRAKGRCFERMMKAFLPPIFAKWERVQTPTNELDILLVLGPRCRFFPALRDWGICAICECKSNTDTFSVTWVDKLAGVLDKHKATVGLVMSQRAPGAKGNGARSWRSLQDYAITGRTIMLVDLEDIQRCIDGENALNLVCTRYTESKLRLKKYRLIAPKQDSQVSV